MFLSRVSKSVGRALTVALIGVLTVGSSASPLPDSRTALAVARLSQPTQVIARGLAVNKEKLREFYSVRAFRLAWDENCVGLGARAATVYDALMSASADGLEPSDYHVREIGQLAAAVSDVERTERDFLITDGLLRYAEDLGAGRLGPRQTDERTQLAETGGLILYLARAAALDPEPLAALLAALPPVTPEYTALKQELPELRRLVESGGWQPLPDGESIHPGNHDPAVPALRQRMIVEGWLRGGTTPAAKANPEFYDSSLASAVAAFQAKHAIRADGVIGKDTRAALDLPAEARLHQAIVNMERARWGDLPRVGRAVEVNLAAYALNVYQDGQPVLNMPVVVGSSDNQTPIISTQITTVVLNPNWTVPPNVIKEILPRIRQDSDYLAGRGIVRIVEGGHVRLVQPPGPTNPLGRYKFIMPNDQDIYLHDSPDVVKFHYALRAYSHGCVRLKNAAALAALLLDDRVSTIPDGLDGIVQKGETRHIALSKPVPVALVYRTTWLDGGGRLVFGPDAYGRDERLWKAMHKPRAPAMGRFASQASKGSLL